MKLFKWGIISVLSMVVLTAFAAGIFLKWGGFSGQSAEAETAAAEAAPAEEVKPEAEAVPAQAAKPEPEPAAEATPTQAAKPEPAPEAEAAPKQEAKPESKPAAEVAPKQEAKPESKPAAEAAPKQEAKPEAAPAEKAVKPTYVNGVLLVNKKYALPADYAPGESKEARNAFNKMAAEAKKAGIGLEAFSTYRSYDYQKKLYNSYVARDGKAAADRYSAQPGHSEHQTGLGFDISEAGRHDARFEESNATRWMAQNAHKYGFIVRYPKGKEHITGYQYEPWHFRYLGVDIATKVYNSGLTLEEYLGVQ